MPQRKTKKQIGSTIWDRVLEASERQSPTAARALLKMRFPLGDQERMRALSNKARQGTLTSHEEAEADAYEQLGCLLDILHSRARRVLKQSRTAS